MGRERPSNADGYEKLNNQVVDKYANDKDAKWGAKKTGYLVWVQTPL